MIDRQIGRFHVLEQVGSGGMSVVYKCIDPRLDREVAIKVLHPHLAAKQESRRRFSQEAKAVAKLRHPNILEIYETSPEDERDAYMVTEYIRGPTLRAFAEGTAFHPPEIAAMAIHELAGALDHAHAVGIIHRDLKPENVMIHEGRVLKLMDFGIAKVLDRDERMTMTGALVGSPAHMAPEIIEGMEAGREADVFSLGTILYWLCCRKLPFLGNNTTQTLKLILDASYADPRLENPAVSDDLARAIGRCLAREPKDRYATAGELQEALASILAACHVEHIGDELGRFFADPASFSQSFRAGLVAQLLGEAERHAQGSHRNAPRVLDRLNRVLALDPHNARAKELIEAMRRHRLRARRRTAAAIALAASGALPLGVYGAFRAWHPPAVAGRAPEPAPAANLPSASAPLTAAAVPPPRDPEIASPAVEPRKPRVKVAEVASSAKAPAPTPTPKPELREVELSLEPAIFTATIHVDGLAESKRGAPFWKLPLAVGDHIARVECPACVAMPIPFSVHAASDEPNLRPITLKLRYNRALIVADVDPAATVLVDNEPMRATDDPRRRMLEIRLPEGREMTTVEIRIVQDGRPTKTWSQEIVAGRTTTVGS